MPGQNAPFNNSHKYLGTQDDDRINGSDGDDIIHGGDGDDRIFGDGGNDTIRGGDGNDRIRGGDGNDAIKGGDGNDHLFGGDGDDSLRGGEGNDYLRGGEGADTFSGGDGYDRVSYAFSPSGVYIDLATDTFLGGNAEGDSFLDAIEEIDGSLYHNDTLIGDDNDQTLKGYAGDDTLYGGGGNDILYGDAGIDSLISDNDTLYGGTGDDILYSSRGADYLDGGDGDDIADYSNSPEAVIVNLETGFTSGGDAEGDTLISIESVYGSDYDDTLTSPDDPHPNTPDNPNYGYGLYGGGGDDILNGGASKDIIFGGAGDDTINGGGGHDGLYGGSGNNDINGGDGSDILRYNDDGTDGAGLITQGVIVNLAEGTATNGWDGEDSLANIERVAGTHLNDDIIGDDNNNVLYGGGGDDHLFGGGGDDTLYGGNNSDALSGGAGSDYLDGGDGDDYADYSLSPVAINVNLQSGVVSGGDADGDTLISIENVYGSAFDDTITTPDAPHPNTIYNPGWGYGLYGGGGDDTLNGGASRDIFTGGADNDTMWGGGGHDTFRFSHGDGHDTILDFTAGEGSEDTIKLSAYGFDGMGDLDLSNDLDGNAVINLGGGDMITLIGVSYLELHADDFIF